MAAHPFLFRRSGDTLTAHVSCGGERHRLHIDATGTAVMANHADAVRLQVLRALGAPPLPCEQVMTMCAAARQWLARRLHHETPAGHFDAHRRWISIETAACCPDVLNAGHAEGVPMLRHHHYVDHASALAGVREHRNHVGTICVFLTDQAGVSPDEAYMTAEWCRLLPDLLSPGAAERLWAFGVTVQFMTAAVAVYPPPGSADPHRHYDERFADAVHDWWTAMLTPEWMRGVAGLAHRLYPDGDTGWVEALASWKAIPVEQVEGYLSAGVRTRLPELYRRNISADQAAQFIRETSLVAGPGEFTGNPHERRALGFWLYLGYLPQTAFKVIAVDPNAAPVLAGAATVKAAQTITGKRPTKAGKQRLLAIGALERSPEAAVTRWQAGLSVAEVAAARAPRSVMPG